MLQAIIVTFNLILQTKSANNGQMVMSIILILMEVVQISVLRQEYFFDYKNYIELLGNILALAQCFDNDNKWLCVVMAILIYTKFLFTLSIFKPYRTNIALIQ